MGDRPLRLHVPRAAQVGDCVTLGGTAARHARVMRLQHGDALELFDGCGWVGTAAVLRFDRAELRCEVTVGQVYPRPPQELTMWVGLTKGDKPDLVVRMLTELGVARICLVNCARSVVKGGGSVERRARLETIAQEACAQSGNPFLPAIDGPLALTDALTAFPLSPDQHGVVLHERGEQLLAPAPLPRSRVVGVVGPEGGLSADEVEMLQNLGFVALRMAGPILRAETAAVVAAARLLDRM